MGYGGGFYDGSSLATPTDRVRAGIALDVQVLPAGTALPAGHFDLRVDAIVTQTETIRCPPRLERNPVLRVNADLNNRSISGYKRLRHEDDHIIRRRTR